MTSNLLTCLFSSLMSLVPQWATFNVIIKKRKLFFARNSLNAHSATFAFVMKVINLSTYLTLSRSHFLLFLSSFSPFQILLFFYSLSLALPLQSKRQTHTKTERWNKKCNKITEIKYLFRADLNFYYNFSVFLHLFIPVCVVHLI